MSLDIRQVIAEDAGVYKCRATNKIGSAELEVNLKCTSRAALDLETIHPEGLKKIHYLETPRQQKRPEAEAKVEAPRFLTPFTDVAIVEGQVAHWECRIEPTNDATLLVEWFHNEQSLKTGSRFQTFHGFGFLSLNILQGIAEDTGKYKCRISNEAGFAEQTTNLTCTAKANLLLDTQHPDSLQQIRYLEDESRLQRKVEVEEIVKTAPKFISNPIDVEIREGDTAHFECRIEPINDNTLRVEWYRNGKTLTVGSRFHTFHDFCYVFLDILQCTEADSGPYVCKIVNEIGTAETTVNLRCASNVNLLKSRESRLMMAPSPVPIDTFTSEEILNLKPPRFVTNLNTVELEEGQMARFECQIEPVHDPTLKIEWFKNGQTLQVGSRFHTFHDFGYVFLNILNSIEEDNGDYVCRVSNLVGQAECKTNLKCIPKATVISETRLPESVAHIRMLEDSSRLKRKVETTEVIKLAPKFVTKFNDVAIAENQMAHFECRIEPVRDNNLKVEWFRNNNPLQIGSRYQQFSDFGHVFLNILQCVEEDSGEYVCRAENKHGITEQSVNLTCQPKSVLEYRMLLDSPLGMRQITELEDFTHLIAENRTAVEVEEAVKRRRMAPMIVVGPSPWICYEGDVAKFTCRVVGYPRPRIMWVLNGNTCINGTRCKLRFDGIYHLEVSKSRLKDTGKIECFVRNIVGEAYCWTTLEVRPRNDNYRVVLQNSPRRKLS